MLLSLNKSLKNIIPFAISLVAIFLLFKFIVFIIPIGALGWLTYKLVGFSKQKLNAARINRISRINKSNINKTFINRDYEKIYTPTDFEKKDSFIDVEYEEIRR